MRWSKVCTLLFLLIGFAIISLKAQKLPEFKSAIRLSEFVNSPTEELRPVFINGGNTMYFTRAYHPANVGFIKVKQNKDIWVSHRNEKGEWSTATNLEQLNDEFDNSVVGADKKNRLFVTSHDKKKKDLQYSIGKVNRNTDGTWSDPEIIHIPTINFSGDFTDFYITPDEKVLLLSISSDKGYGKEDIYVSHKKDEVWSAPKNVGTYINTSGHEFAPFLSDDKRHLYFTTTGRGGQGHGDVFVATRLDESWQYWSEPVNLGEVVNSKGMDCYFTISKDNKYYVSSNRVEENGMDIYELSNKELPKEPELDLLTVKGYISDSVSNEFLTSEITITNVETNESVKTLSNRSGFYTIKLEKGKIYRMNILRAPYHEVNVLLNTPEAEKEIEEFWQHFQLSKYEKGDKIELENLHFHTSSARLTEASQPILQKLITIMNSNETMRIKIIGHTDNSGSKLSLIKLSQQRAVAIKEALIDSGVSKKRLKTKGYGGAKPLVKNDSEKNKRKNRRVEFVIF